MLVVPLVFCLSVPVICIDPGHPSEVGPGTRGRRSTEIQVAWRIARRLEEALKRDGVNVVLTKHREDELVKNRRRAEIANSARASLMLRLHCDAGTGSGFAVYYPSQVGTVSGMSGPGSDVIEKSHEAAVTVHSTMAGILRGSLPDEGLKTDRQTAVGSKQGALTGSIFSQVPVVLVEMVVLPNRKDEDWILSSGGEALMVKALEQGALKAIGR